MFKLPYNAIMVVKYANNAFVEYRCNKGRSIDAIMRYFRNKADFRFAVIYKYDRIRKERQEQIFYFDKWKFRNDLPL